MINVKESETPTRANHCSGRKEIAKPIWIQDLFDESKICCKIVMGDLLVKLSSMNWAKLSKDSSFSFSSLSSNKFLLFDLSTKISSIFRSNFRTISTKNILKSSLKMVSKMSSKPFGGSSIITEESISHVRAGVAISRNGGCQVSIIFRNLSLCLFKKKNLSFTWNRAKS